MSNFKIKPTPGAQPFPAPIKAPAEKAGLPISGGGTDRAVQETSPDGPRAGYSTGASGKRQYKDEKPYPPPAPPAKQYKVTKP
jgi:hypothetical protein